MSTNAPAALITDACHFVGASSGHAIARRTGRAVACQDASFTDTEARAEFEAKNPGLMALGGQTGDALVAELADRGFWVHTLVNNDAYPAERGPVDEYTSNDFRRMLDALMVTPFERTGAVVPEMKKQGEGRIIFVTSAAPLRGLANYPGYAAARGGANALAKTLAVELARFNIQVNAVAPNFIESPTYFPPHLMENPDTASKILKNIPLGRLGRQEEAAGVVAFLAGDEAGFLTGQVIPVAGGWA